MDTIICQDCGKEFTKIARLQRHIRESHMNLKPFKCDYCDKQFKRKFHLTRHMVAHSENPKPFTCTIENCTQRFSNKHHLTRHVKIIHDQDRYRCKLCDTRFKKKSQLQKHIKESHYTLYNQDDFTPMYSEDAFFYEDSIEKKVKKDEEQYQLGMVASTTRDTECFLDFNFDALVRATSETDCAFLQEEMKSQPKKDFFKCPYDNCFKTFSMVNTLRSHIRTSHLKVKPFKCVQSGCKAKFSHQNALTSHCLKKHANQELGTEFTGLLGMTFEDNFDVIQQDDMQNFCDYSEDDYFTSFLASSPLRFNLSLRPDLLEDFL